MNKVHFLPFVGKKYANGICGKRVLGLGESIYGNKLEDRDVDATKRRVDMHTSSDNPFDNWMNTYTKFIRALSGDSDISRNQTIEYWNKIIFYNYVQKPLEGSRKAPCNEAFSQSEEAFMEILKEYKPDMILVWGNRLSKHLPSCFVKGDDVILPDGVRAGTKVCDINGHRIRALIMYHPSYVRFSSPKWHEYDREIFK